ncbi:NADH dehydrogenase subunit I F [Pseudomonas aeruginosa PA38182]|nr:NADH dehydrogenase subunit I F [Pseudomonas aeruginosa PA38182]
MNNVETLCNVPAIVGNGVDWYKTLARPGSEDMGTKLMGFSGKVKNPGLWELPFGVSARELFEDYAGGMRDGFQLKAWQPGGAGTGFLLPEHLDAQMFAGGIAKVGTRMGTGLAMAVDDSINMVSLLRNMEEFFARESCGWCTPCRDGLPWSVKLLRAWSGAKASPATSRPSSSWSTSSAQARPSAPTRREPSSRWAAPSSISVPNSRRASPASLRPRRARQRSAPDALQPDGQPSGDVSSSCRGPAAGPTEP